MKTIRFTKLSDGYYIANNRFQMREGAFDSFDAVKSFAKAEVGDASSLFVWIVNNGVAHVLNVRVSSLI